jgi:hypothetical protein
MLARQWVAGCGTPFHETINTNAAPTDPVWVTLEFNVENTEVSTFCDDYVEEGVIELVVLANAGAGDGAAIQAAETAGRYMMRQADPTGALVLRKAMAPEEFSGGDADPSWYRVFIGLEYRYNHHNP